MKRFLLIGAAGYIAERHMKAIRETGNNLACTIDRFDVMGRIDSYFPEAEFFSDFADLSAFIAESGGIDYASVCTPNYLHSAHILYSMAQGADVICEKPLVLNPAELNTLYKAERETGKRVFNILQLRLHPVIEALKKHIDSEAVTKKYDVDLTYITSRGKWYQKSWKGNPNKSGGVANNIGIHFFDMLIWIFGAVQNVEVHLYQDDKAAGFLELENARVRWFLSLDYNDLPPTAKKSGRRTYRSITFGNEEIEFSDGFTELHTESYRRVLEGKGFGLDDVAPCLDLTYRIRNTKVSENADSIHPFVKKD